jgi:RimJ/RimL family protein N-acetyltransferase
VFPVEIETERLRLRRPVPSDAESIFRAYAQDPEVTRYLVWRPHSHVETTRHFIAECESRWANLSGFPYMITPKVGGDPIGMIDLKPFNHSRALEAAVEFPYGIEFGCVLARIHWGNGFMPEAISAVVRVSLSTATIYRVQATCDIENRASARALEKAGLSYEGVLRKYIIHPNISLEPRDSLLYASTR